MANDIPENTAGSLADVPLAGNVHPPVYQITDILTFQLAQLVAIHERYGGSGAAREFGVSLNEWRVIGLARALAPVRTGRIGDRLAMDKGQLSRVVRVLVDKGYLRTRPDELDARATLLELTDAGFDLHDRLLAFAADRNERIAEALTREECEMLMTLVGRLTVHNRKFIEPAPSKGG